MITVLFHSDCNFSSLSDFESHVFADNPEQEVMQHTLHGPLTAINDRGDLFADEAGNADARKKLRTIFDDSLAKMNGSAVAMRIDLLPENEDDNVSMLDDAYSRIALALARWCAANRHVCAIAPHLDQVGKVPHCHAIIQLVPAGLDDLQEYMRESLSEEE